jgi:hypothetical protein
VVTKKLQIQEENHLSKSYNINGVPIVEKEDAGDLYLKMKLDGIDKNFNFFCFSISSGCLNEGIDLPI